MKSFKNKHLKGLLTSICLITSLGFISNNSAIAMENSNTSAININNKYIWEKEFTKSSLIKYAKSKKINFNEDKILKVDTRKDFLQGIIDTVKTSFDADIVSQHCIATMVYNKFLGNKISFESSHGIEEMLYAMYLTSIEDENDVSKIDYRLGRSYLNGFICYQYILNVFTNDRLLWLDINNNFTQCYDKLFDVITYKINHNDTIVNNVLKRLKSAGINVSVKEFIDRITREKRENTLKNFNLDTGVTQYGTPFSKTLINKLFITTALLFSKSKNKICNNCHPLEHKILHLVSISNSKKFNKEIFDYLLPNLDSIRASFNEISNAKFYIETTINLVGENADSLSEDLINFCANMHHLLYTRDSAVRALENLIQERKIEDRERKIEAYLNCCVASFINNYSSVFKNKLYFVLQHYINENSKLSIEEKNAIFSKLHLSNDNYSVLKEILEKLSPNITLEDCVELLQKMNSICYDGYYTGLYFSLVKQVAEFLINESNVYILMKNLN